MKMNKFLLAGLVMMGSTAFAAGNVELLAQAGDTTGGMGMEPGTQTQPQTQQPEFSQLDANSDGALTREEVVQSPMLSDRFDDVDANADGQLSAEEFDQWQMQQEQGGQY